MKLKAYMDMKKMSQQELADHLDVDRSAVARWYHGVRSPRRDAARKIVDFTMGAVTYEDLYS